MAKYSVILSSRVEAQLLQHTEFLARVSIPAAKRFRAEYARMLDRLEDNPHQFPLETDPNLPADRYRKALFAKRYKALFSIAEGTVYLDAVVDCRQQTEPLDN
jgi:plasmid stabilization system protein ParE